MPDSPPLVSLEIPVARLDDFDYRQVSVIKIDVEGHEEEVILGRAVDYRCDRPALFVEVGNGHRRERVVA